jgi:hypothetical protein
MQKLLEERKNWTQMTPEEILGVAPKEDMLKPPERDVMGREKQTSQLERYLDRETRMRGGLTNGWQSSQDNSPWQWSRDRNGLNPLDSQRDSTDDAAQRLSEYLNSQRMGESPVNRADKNFGWDSFSPPAPQSTAKPDPEQMAAMDRFRQFLNPAPAPAAEASSDGKYFHVSKTAAVADSYMNQPDYVPNPAGSSFTPLTSGIGKPSGLMPLPGVVSQGIAPESGAAWTPQPAPWLIQGPKPFVMPQRKF